MNPPYEMMDKVVEKLKKVMGRAIVIAPMWTQTKWLVPLQAMAVRQMTLEHREGVFLLYAETPMKTTRWNSVAFLVDPLLTLTDNMPIMVRVTHAMTEGFPDVLE